jgi:hypothetical protein
MTRRKFSEQFLEGIGAPATRRNLAAVMAVIQAEGDSARCNPLNTTWPLPGSWVLAGNWAGVREYQDFEDGIDASCRTLNTGAAMAGDPYGYKPIRHRFRTNKGATGTLIAWEKSAWGTGGLALACLPQTYLRFKHYSNLELRGS